MNIMDTPGTMERKLSPTEKFFWLADKACRFNFTMHARILGTLPSEALRKALASVQARHPMLRVRIEMRGRSAAWFVEDNVPEIPLRLAESLDGKWVSFAEKELDTAVDTQTGPLARCLLLDHGEGSQTLILTFHHAIGDGISGAFLMRDLLSAAATARDGDDPELSPLPPKREMDAYFPAFARGWRGRRLYDKFTSRVLGLFFKHGLPSMPSVDQKAPLGQRKARIIPLTLEEPFVSKLTEKARQENTTVHGALVAALEMALIHDRGKEKPMFFLVGSPVNLRHRLEPPVVDDLGLFVTMGVSANKAGPGSDFWQVARQVKESLSNCVDRGEPFAYLYQHRDLNLINKVLGSGDRGGTIYADLAARVNRGLGFTNIGRLDLETAYGGLRLESMGFAASGSALCPFICFASTINGRMSLNFMGMEPLYAREHTRRIAEQALDVLENAVFSV